MGLGYTAISLAHPQKENRFILKGRSDQLRVLGWVFLALPQMASVYRKIYCKYVARIVNKKLQHLVYKVITVLIGGPTCARPTKDKCRSQGGFVSKYGQYDTWRN